MKQAKKRFGRAAVASLFCATVLAASLPALPAAAATLAGDVNLDGSVNLSDVVAMQQYLLQERTLSAEAGANADYNADGVCNVIDLAMIKRTVLESDPVTNTIAIHLSDSGITVENDTKGVTSVSGKTVTISASGSYTVDGSMADGQILVNIPDTTADADDVELILNNVTMTSCTVYLYTVGSKDKVDRYRNKHLYRYSNRSQRRYQRCYLCGRQVDRDKK